MQPNIGLLDFEGTKALADDLPNDIILLHRWKKLPTPGQMDSMRLPILSNTRPAALLKSIKAIVPLEVAEHSWDNVGMIFEALSPEDPSGQPHRVMLAIDLDEKIVLEARKKGCQSIVTYHPPWFRPAKRLTSEPGSEARIIAYCAAINLSVISLHTSLDNMRPGSTDRSLLHNAWLTS